jgi:hypothetical protein
MRLCKMQKKAAFDIRELGKQLAKTVRNVPLEAYTTAAGAGLGAGAVGLLKKDPKLTHYLAGAGLGGAAGFGGGAAARHYLEGYKAKQQQEQALGEQYLDSLNEKEKNQWPPKPVPETSAWADKDRLQAKAQAPKQEQAKAQASSQREFESGVQDTDNMITRAFARAAERRQKADATAQARSPEGVVANYGSPQEQADYARLKPYAGKYPNAAVAMRAIEMRARRAAAQLQQAGAQARADERNALAAARESATMQPPTSEQDIYRAKTQKRIDENQKVREMIEALRQQYGK